MQGKKNRIPREFHRIRGRILQETSHDQPGDVLHITKNLHGYLGLNKRTGRHGYYFAQMLRDGEYFEVLEVVKD